MKYLILLTLAWIFSFSHGDNVCDIHNGNTLHMFCVPVEYIIKDESVSCPTTETLIGSIKAIAITGCPFNDLHLFRNCTSLSLFRLRELYLVRKEAVVGLNQLTHFEIINSNIEVHASAFSQLPNLRKVELTHNNNLSLSELPFQGAHQLKYLGVKDSSISTLPSGLFRDLNGLEVLNLGIPLISLSASDFTGLEKLKYLTLTNIEILTWSVNSFHILKNLKYLLLNYCKFRYIGPMAFSPLQNLIYLNLERNEIEQLNASAFSGLTNLRSLGLKKNNIIRIEDGAFSNLKNLKRLDLSDNKLTALDEQSFNGLDNLKYLSLNRNSISAINANTFTALTKLIQLDLCFQDNEIESLDLNAFPQFIDLETESVIYTPISWVPDDFEKEESLWFKEMMYFEDHINVSTIHSLLFGSFQLNRNGDRQIMEFNNLAQHVTDQTLIFGNLDLSNNRITSINVVKADRQN